METSPILKQPSTKPITEIVQESRTETGNLGAGDCKPAVPVIKRTSKLEQVKTAAVTVELAEATAVPVKKVTS